MSIKITTDAFIEKAFIKHGNRFNYSDVDYKSNKKLVIIKCNKHNLIFNQTPSNHLNGYGGCLMCKQELVTKSSTNYIKEVSQIHNNFYIYDKTIYRLSSKDYGLQILFRPKMFVVEKLDYELLFLSLFHLTTFLL